MPPVTSDEYDLELVLKVCADSCIRNFSVGDFVQPLEVKLLVLCIF